MITSKQTPKKQSNHHGVNRSHFRRKKRPSWRVVTIGTLTNLDPPDRLRLLSLSVKAVFPPHSDLVRLNRLGEPVRTEALLWRLHAFNPPKIYTNGKKEKAINPNDSTTTRPAPQPINSNSHHHSWRGGATMARRQAKKVCGSQEAQLLPDWGIFLSDFERFFKGICWVDQTSVGGVCRVEVEAEQFGLWTGSF